MMPCQHSDLAVIPVFLRRDVLYSISSMHAIRIQLKWSLHSTLHFRLNEEDASIPVLDAGFVDFYLITSVQLVSAIQLKLFSQFIA
jgi:hypothetical protein